MPHVAFLLATGFDDGEHGFDKTTSTGALRAEGKLAPKSIVLFGSYQKGEDIENSDIDIFVECKKEKLNIDNNN